MPHLEHVEKKMRAHSTTGERSLEMGMGDTSRLDEFLETLDHFGTVALEEHDGAAGNAVAELELFRVFVDEVQHHFVGGQVASFG